MVIFPLRTIGWVVYFRIADAKGVYEKLERWVVRRLRCLIWRQWKTSRTRFNKLLSFDVNRKKAAFGRSGSWFSSCTSAMNFALQNAFFREKGWVGFTFSYAKYRVDVKVL